MPKKRFNIIANQTYLSKQTERGLLKFFGEYAQRKQIYLFFELT